ncbi:phosphate starvation-inducible protein PhoH [bacterium SM23_31]|nr:MAG: phosphate starvation-inducible protein PhoH [bacterium SM23_31]
MIEVKKTFDLHGIDPLIFLGMNDSNLKIIQKHFDAKITVRGQNVILSGDEETVQQIENLLSELIFHINKFKKLDRQDVETAIRLIQIDKPPEHTKKELDSVILFTDSGYIRPRTEGQLKYYKSVQKNEIAFAIGPAGTGKTYLAVAMAVQFLKSKRVKRIILSRPAVEAGESLGFLPGDLREKIEPYLWPLHDALNDMLPQAKLKRLIEDNIIEIIPLAYMRGRTLNNAFVILDEAQNSSTLQMKMFLTRLGPNSRSIITGDITQVDLHDKSQSGLIQIQHILKGIPGIDFIYMESTDIVRHRLVKDIIKAYDKYNAGGGNSSAAGAALKSTGKSAE